MNEYNISWLNGVVNLSVMNGGSCSLHVIIYCDLF